ncbi:hypothetical protein JZO70_21100 [Enterococcus sp. 669A]|uniref:Lipoprotein n=1 Tax=Candidatus Enterococcus moelleringii TaxID=2815325 RepID=A0ABS3LHV2_9ENTE|nr:hypothetical protein [Enterococcus sp. 669A]MBO1308685.1 hypothetical protein [Enterococcus sp. 669A]
MKKLSIILTSGLSLVLLSACTGGSNETAQESSSNVVSTSTSSSISSSTTQSSQTENEKYDELPQELKIVAMADIVDSRIKDYPNLEGLTLHYLVDNDDVYLFITSGVGSGHPIYKLSVSEEGVTPVQGVVYMGMSGGYEEAEVDNQLVTKETLLENYNDDKTNFDNSSKNVEEDTHLKELFNEQMNQVSNPSQQTNAAAEPTGTQPSDDEMLKYFVDYVLDDVGGSSSSIKDQANYGVDENGAKMIRYGGSQGAYATIEGNRIIYTAYSFGGVSDDGTVAKSSLYSAYYDFVTGEHGML